MAGRSGGMLIAADELWGLLSSRELPTWTRWLDQPGKLCWEVKRIQTAGDLRVLEYLRHYINLYNMFSMNF